MRIEDETSKDAIRDRHWSDIDRSTTSEFLSDVGLLEGFSFEWMIDRIERREGQR